MTKKAPIYGIISSLSESKLHKEIHKNDQTPFVRKLLIKEFHKRNRN